MRRASNWLWPNNRNRDDGIFVRLGRVLHWACAAAGGALIAVAVLMAVVALLSGSASAQENEAFNEASPAMQQIIKDQRALQAETEKRQTVRWEDLQPQQRETGTLADVIEQGPDLRPVQPAGPNSFAEPRKTVDWELLQQAVGVFVLGLVLVFVGRGLRYILSNE